MKITVLDDYQNVVRTLDAFKKVEGHDVTIWNDHTKDTDVLAERLKDTEALVLIRERTPIRAPLIERLSKLKIISQRSVYPHVDVDALTKKGIVLCSDMITADASVAPRGATARTAGQWPRTRTRRPPRARPAAGLRRGLHRSSLRFPHFRSRAHAGCSRDRSIRVSHPQ